LYVFYFFNIHIQCVDKGTKHYYLYDNDGNRIELEQSDGEKDIGVLVDENLSFNKHIQNQVNKANSIMGLIRRTYTHLESDQLCKLSKSA
jgi:hypothetical protein